MAAKAQVTYYEKVPARAGESGSATEHYTKAHMWDSPLSSGRPRGDARVASLDAILINPTASQKRVHGYMCGLI